MKVEDVYSAPEMGRPLDGYREMFPIMRWERLGREEMPRMSDGEQRNWIAGMLAIAFIVVAFVTALSWCGVQH